jgi:hypothetical protein
MMRKFPRLVDITTIIIMCNLSMVVVSEIDGSGKKVLVICIALIKVGVGLLLINVVKFVLFPVEEEYLGCGYGVEVRIDA